MFISKSIVLYQHDGTFSILVDIQQILISDDPGPLQMSDVTINRRLDEFTLQFQVNLDQRSDKLSTLLIFPYHRKHWVVLKAIAPALNEAHHIQHVGLLRRSYMYSQYFFFFDNVS